MLTSRRRFLSLLGLGTAAAAVPAIATPFVRRVWAVPSNAPVGSRIESVPVHLFSHGVVDYPEWRTDISAETWAPSRWALEHGYTYSPPEPITLLPATPEWRAIVEAEQERRTALSGINSVVRGSVACQDALRQPMTQASCFQLAQDMLGRGLFDADAMRAVLADAPSRIDYFITTDRGDQNA